MKCILIFEIIQLSNPLVGLSHERTRNCFQNRPHLDYGDVIYDRVFNKSFQNKLESVQYDAALAITEAIRGSSKEKLYQELGLGSLKSRRWYRKLCLFFKLKKNKHPLTSLI